jgi:hypothetical protein
MPDHPTSPGPRLTATTAPSDYAPLSWPAVASLAAATLFVVVLTVLAYFAKQPLVESWLFVFPAVGIVLAFTARRQIEASEGTRTGLSLASAGWWVSVLGGMGYVAYLMAINYAVENDAKREFTAWAETVKQINPDDPRDPKLYEAVYRTVAPRQRAEVKNAKDYDKADVVFRDQLAKLRQTDVVRVAGRNREAGSVEFSGFGVKDWSQTPGVITCTLAGKMTTPEGDRMLLVPMQATVDRGVRQWQINAAGDGFFQPGARNLTRYGWMVEYLEAAGRQYAMQFLFAVDRPESRRGAFQMFAQDPAAATAAGVGAAVAGLPAAIGRGQADYEQALAGKLFSLPGGGTPGPDDLARFRQCWERGGIGRAGSTLRDSPDTSPILRVADGAVELRVPVELTMSAAHGSATEAARGKLVLRAADPALAGDLAAAKQAKGVATPEPPKDVVSRQIPWRVVRIESDLKMIQPPAPTGGPGEGGPGGMMGG